MVKFISLASVLPYIANSYIFIESEEQIKNFNNNENNDYIGNLANNNNGPLRMLRPSAPKSPTEKKKEFLSKLINYLQSDNNSENYINYGCWCFNDENDITKGHGHPVDKIDENCRSFSHCYQCTKMTFDCSVYSGYKYFGREDGNGTRSVECLNDEFGDPEEQCRHTLCECDKRLAQQLAKNKNSWKIENHRNLGDFDEASCKASSSGSKPARISGGSNNLPLQNNDFQGPLRLIGGGPSGSIGNFENEASPEELEQFYQDNYNGDIYTDIYDSQNEFLNSEYTDSDPQSSNSKDLRNLFSNGAISGNLGSNSNFHHSQNDLNEHQCCGDSPSWFPYNTAQGRRACCNGKTYDTHILSCCDDGSLRSSC